MSGAVTAPDINRPRTRLHFDSRSARYFGL